MSDYCEWPEFYNETFPRARFAHICIECRRPIKVGEKHLYYGGKWSGDFSSGRQHMDCRELCMTIREIQQDECVPFGGLFEDNCYTCDLRRNGTDLEKKARKLLAGIKLRMHRTPWKSLKEIRGFNG